MCICVHDCIYVHGSSLEMAERARELLSQLECRQLHPNLVPAHLPRRRQLQLFLQHRSIVPSAVVVGDGYVGTCCRLSLRSRCCSASAAATCDEYDQMAQCSQSDRRFHSRRRMFRVAPPW